MQKTDLSCYLSDISDTVYYCPNPGNAGDSAIALGTYQLFDHVGLRYTLVGWDEPFDSTGQILVYGGGGNLTSDYSNARTFLEQHHERARRLILLPHTVQGHADLLKSLGRNVEIFCRERRSYEWVQENAEEANVYLADDLAFALNPGEMLGTQGVSVGMQAIRIVGQIRRAVAKRYWGGYPGAPRLQTAVAQGAKALVNLGKSAGKGRVLHAIRTDAEQEGGELPNGNVDLSRVFEYGMASEATARKATKLLFAFLNRFDRVVTNRLHLCILAALLGKDVDFYANSYYKNEAVYEFSIKGQFPNVCWRGRWVGQQ